MTTDNMSVSELARECGITVSPPERFREKVRMSGALDHLANMDKELKDSKLVWGQQQMMLLEIVEIAEEGERVKVR